MQPLASHSLSQTFMTDSGTFRSAKVSETMHVVNDFLTVSLLFRFAVLEAFHRKPPIAVP
jgi:hypothetical protein